MTRAETTTVRRARRLYAAVEAAEAALPEGGWLELAGMGDGEYVIEARSWPPREDIRLLARAPRAPLADALEDVARRLRAATAAEPGS